MLPVWALAQGGGPGWDGQPSKRWVRETIQAASQAGSNYVASAIASSATQGSNYAAQVAGSAQNISTNDAYHKGRRTRDLTFSNTAARAVSIQRSDSLSSGRALSVVAGSTTNNLLADFTTLPVDISSQSVHSLAAIGNDAYYACWGTDGIFVQTNRTGTWRELPGTDAHAWSALLSFNGTLLAAASLGDIYSVDTVTGALTPLNAGTNAYWTGLATDGSDVYAVSGEYNQPGDLWKLTGGSGPAASLNHPGDWSDIAYAPVAGKYYVTYGGGFTYRVDGGSLTQVTTYGGDMIAIDAQDNIYLGNTDLKVRYAGTSNFVTAPVQTESAFISDGVFAADGALYCVTSGDHIYLALPGGTANLSGGPLYLDAGLGKGTGQSRVVIRTGAKQGSGTTMQPLTDRLTIDEDGTVTSTGPIVLPAPGTAALHAATVGQLAGNVLYANITSALARARAPQAVTYSGTNVTTDARLGTLFRINATNDFRLHKPTGAYDGQGFLYWIKQHVGGTNTVTMTTGDFVPPVGSSTVVLSVTNGCVDQFVGIWDASINKVRIGSFMRYTE
jgi:hypothetical protein